VEAHFIYLNHKGDRKIRRANPRIIRFGRTGWHPKDQWLLEAYDLDKRANRTFAMADILYWFPPQGASLKVSDKEKEPATWGGETLTAWRKRCNEDCIPATPFECRDCASYKTCISPKRREQG